MNEKNNENLCCDANEGLLKYEQPKLIVEGNYSTIFFGFHVGVSCTSVCSRHMPEI